MLVASGATTSLAIAQSLADCDARVATCVPGFGATQAFAEFSALAGGAPFSYHEEVAFNVAHGAALAGTRAAFLTKVHGLHKAANALFDALSAGTTAGFVVLVFEDKDGAHSDSVVDVLPFLRAARVPHASVSPRDVRRRVADAFAASERSGLPHVLVLDAADAQAQAHDDARPAPRLPAPPPFRRDPASHLLCPPLARHQRAILDARLEGKPLPPPPRLPRVPQDLPGAWAPLLASYGGVFDAFREVRGAFVAGDAGTCSVFGFPPYDAIDVTTCMGGSTALALGARLAGLRDAWAVTGDFSFVSAGHLGLAEAYARDEPLKVLLLANGEAAATGGQPMPRAVLDRALAPYAADVRWVRSDEKTAVEAALREAAAHEGPRIVAVDVR